MSGKNSGALKNIGIVAAAVGSVALLAWSWTANMTQAPIELGYYCLSCKKTDHQLATVSWRDERFRPVLLAL